MNNIRDFLLLFLSPFSFFLFFFSFFIITTPLKHLSPIFTRKYVYSARAPRTLILYFFIHDQFTRTYDVNVNVYSKE